MRGRGGGRGGWSWLALVVLAGCAAGPPPGPPPRAETVDPNATLVAREQPGGMALERLASGNTGAIVAAVSGSSPVVRVGQQDVAWLAVGEQQVVARSGAAEGAPVLGRVTLAWDDQAVRLAIEPARGAPIRSDVFRSGGGTGQILLSRNAAMLLDLRGSFTSPLRDADGDPVGWLRVRIGPTGGTSYEGVMPPGVSDAMAAATVAALQHEIDWLAQQLDGTTRPQDAD